MCVYLLFLKCLSLLEVRYGAKNKCGLGCQSKQHFALPRSGGVTRRWSNSTIYTCFVCLFPYIPFP